MVDTIEGDSNKLKIELKKAVDATRVSKKPKDSRCSEVLTDCQF